MKKQLTALVLTLALTLSAAVTPYAAGFSDVGEFHEWAEPQIEEMTTLGIIKGYTDGTFRPDRAITKTEALVLISRAAGYIAEDYTTFRTAAYTRYSDAVAKYNTPYPNEVAFLLYKGVLTEEDLASYISSDRSDSPLLRYEMAILLTKLMRAEGSLNNAAEISLEYADAGEIPFAAAAHVEYVTNASLMQGVYDPTTPDEVYFKPYSSVTRAQVAVLLHRVLSKSEISVKYAQAVGKNTTNSTVTYRDNAGKTAFYTVSDGVNFIVDGYNTKDVSHVHSGAQMAFFYINNTLADVEIVNPEANRFDGVEKGSVKDAVPTEPVSGNISTIIFSDDCRVVVDNVEYTLSSAASIYVNDATATIYDLRVGHNVEMDFKNGKVIMLYATSPQHSADGRVTATGTITMLSVTNRQLYIAVENSETGITNERVLNIETGAVIINGISGEKVDFLALEIDDRIIVTGQLKEDGNLYASKVIVR